ncbi:MAG: class I adenylate-forming enzyme family protein [Pseudomonadota bacterium]
MTLRAVTLSISQAGRAAPRLEALACEGERLTFGALAARVEYRISALAAFAVCSERPVALLVDGSVHMFELLYALIELGIPLLPIHPRLTAKERAHLLELSDAQTLLDPAQIEPARAAHGAWQPAQIPDERALAFVPTSGSSGTPKLTLLSRRAFLALADADAERVPPRSEDRALLCLPLSHVGGLSVVLRCLLARRCCVVFRGPGLLDSIPELAQTLVDERISLLSLVPPVLARLLREAPGALAQAPLRALLLGGQACSEALFTEARAHGLPILTSYGLTETCSQASTLAWPVPERVGTRNGVVSVGFALPGVELRVAQGLIEVRGPTLFSGYVGEPSPFTADGFFPTGDRGELDPQLGLFVFGRQNELIITGGENVDPSEVEHALLACGGLGAVAVFGIPDAEFGATVAAALEPAPGVPFDERTLFAALDKTLASFKQPRVVRVVEALPRLPSGKLDRARIRQETSATLRAPERPPRH